MTFHFSFFDADVSFFQSIVFTLALFSLVLAA